MSVDMNILHGIQKFLQYVNDNWTMITIIISLVFVIAKKAKSFFGKSDEEKIAVAKKQIQEIMLKLVTDAEVDYQEWVSAGGIKRSQVIEKIFNMFPVLSKVTDQESLIAWLDRVIDMSLETMREIFEKQQAEEDKFVEDVVD